MATKKNEDSKPRARKSAPKKSNRNSVENVKESTLEDGKAKRSKKPSGQINDGKCCRCVFRNVEKKCASKKSEKNGKYVPRKFGCDNFKRK